MSLADINPFAGLGYGNAAAARTYTWDGENRLVRVEPTDGTFLPAGTKRLTFVYDYQGRRIRKQVETYGNGQWSVTDVRAFVYQGWRIVLELDARDLNSDGVPDNTVLRKYTWGLDLAGQMGGVGILPANLVSAAGIRGVLAVVEPQTVGEPHRFVYEGNGRVCHW